MGQLTGLFGPPDWWNVGPMGLFILGGAVFRIASMLVYEEGPWDIFCRLRHRLGVRYDERSQPFGLNVVGKALCCLWCTSVWVGMAGVLSVMFAPWLTMTLSLPFALSALAILLSKAVGNE